MKAKASAVLMGWLAWRDLISLIAYLVVFGRSGGVMGPALVWLIGSLLASAVAAEGLWNQRPTRGRLLALAYCMAQIAVEVWLALWDVFSVSHLQLLACLVLSGMLIRGPSAQEDGPQPERPVPT